MCKLSLELARDILEQVAELQSSVVEGVNLSTMHPEDDFVHAIADQIDEYYQERDTVTIYVIEGVDISYNPDDWAIIAATLDKGRAEEIRERYLVENPDGCAIISFFTDGGVKLVIGNC